MRNDLKLFEVIEACRYLGVSFLPLNWHATASEINYILNDSGASILVSHDDLYTNDLAELSSKLCVLTYPTPSNVMASYHVSKNNHTREQNEQDMIGLCKSTAPIETPVLPFKGMLAYTSGSTGMPKGIQRQLSEERADLYPVYEGLASKLMHLEKGDRYYISAPLYHSAPNTLSLCCIAAQNVDVYVEPKFEAEKFLHDIEKFKITHTYIVPTMMVRLLKLNDEIKNKYDISSLKFAISSGSAWPAEVKQAMIDWFGPIFYESYGSSETGFITLISSVEAQDKPGSVGKVLPGGSIKIVDDHRNEMSCGESGSIFVYLPMFGEFAYSNPEQNEADMRFEGHTTVGDVGYLDSDGYLFINDRKKDMVISGGANIFPAEIEALMIDMPEISDCALFGVPDAEFGERLIAAVTCQNDCVLTIEEVHQFLEGKLARFKYPRELYIHSALPREDSGKIFKQKLKVLYQP
jgi:long-chain acyl-CoA synthetase